MDHAQQCRLVEAILFMTSDPVTEEMLREFLPKDADIGAVMADLAAHYENRGVHLEAVAGGWALRTAPDLAPHLRRERDVARKLSRAAMETLAIVAYHQPVTRAEIEDIRGVAVSRGTLDILFEAGWIEPKGRRRTPGKPLTWGTTARFLDHFGLLGLDDLPGIDDLKAAGLLDASIKPPTLSERRDDDLLPEPADDPDAVPAGEPLEDD